MKYGSILCTKSCTFVCERGIFRGGAIFENSENQISGKRGSGKAAKGGETAAESGAAEIHRDLRLLSVDSGAGCLNRYSADGSGERHDADLAEKCSEAHGTAEKGRGGNHHPAHRGRVTARYPALC